MFGFKKRAIKLCKDCKWAGAGIFYSPCLHDKAVLKGELSLVSGEIGGGGRRSCYIMRNCGGCGEKAKYFEAKGEGDANATNTA